MSACLKFSFVLVMLFAPLAQAQNCDFYVGPFEACVQLDWQRGPIVGEESRLLVEFESGASVQLSSAKLWMPDMGHGSSPVKIEKLSKNRFLITEMYFVMGGLWDIHFSLKQGSKKYDFKESIRL